MTNRMSYVMYQVAPLSMILDDFEGNVSYFKYIWIKYHMFATIYLTTKNRILYVDFYLSRDRFEGPFKDTGSHAH